MNIFLIKQIVSKDGNLHFKRWRIIETPWFNIYIHGIYHKDEEAHMHDHPWNFYSFILYGGYVEQTENGFSNRTLFTGKYNRADAIREWGYKTENGWIDNITYRKLKNN